MNNLKNVLPWLICVGLIAYISWNDNRTYTSNVLPSSFQNYLDGTILRLKLVSKEENRMIWREVDDNSIYIVEDGELLLIKKSICYKFQNDDMLELINSSASR